MKRFRSISKAIEEIKAEDPRTEITEYAIRDAVRNGNIPCRRIKNKHVVSVEDIIAYYEGE